MSTNSSDGRVQVDVHAAYASALVYVDLVAAGAPSSITIYRNGVALVTQDNTAGTAAWYDHFPPYGSVSYTASANAGAITTTAATVTITAPTDGKAWLKGVDPNLSTRVALDHFHPIGETDRPKDRGIFRGAMATYPVILEGPLGARATRLDVKVYTSTDRDRVMALVAAGPVYIQPPAKFGESPMWASLGTPRQSFTRLVRTGGLWHLSMPADEVSAPTLNPDAVIIPGWGWDQVAATYATWDAVAAAKATWIALLRQGVGA